MSNSVSWLACAVLLMTLSAAVQAQAPAPEDAARLQRELVRLDAALQALPEDRRSGTAFVDAAVCAKATEWILRHEEFYRPQYVKAVDEVLALGFSRVEGIQQGLTKWGHAPGGHGLAYRSKVDGSVQPYALTLPRGFDSSKAKAWPLYVVLHGRSNNLTEASFVAQIEGKEAPESQTWIQLDVFGRTNNAYRWAGESDVFEALADVQRRYRIDEQRVTLWGFSMGGAGAWHLGLHHPSRWASVGAGAGFVDYYAYQKKTEKLPEPQHTLLTIYDSTGYAENLANVPFITYGGEEDPQLLASTTMKSLAEQADVPLQMLVGPKMGHKFDDQSLAKFMAFLAEHNATGRSRAPGKREIRFTTHTLKYNACEWLKIEEQLEPFAASTIESRDGDDNVLEITTTNVAALSIDRQIANRVSLDGSEPLPLLDAADGLLPDVYCVLGDDGNWTVLDYDDSRSFMENTEGHKRHDLQGPIDDAFMGPFVCVKGTGQPWSPQLQSYSEKTLTRFSAEYDKYLRGTLPMVEDNAVSDKVVERNNLILFGDPGSNAVIARVLNELPIEWTREAITVNGKSYDPATHAAVFVFPNPMNPTRYIVINSGMTMRAKDFEASNANLFPKLGDIAVIKYAIGTNGGLTEETVWSGMFDGHWQLP